MTSLRLENLHLGLPAITPAFGTFLAEAAQVCLQNWGHKSGQVLWLKAKSSTEFSVYWEEMESEQLLRTWADQQEATEYGATAIAILLVLQMTDFTVVRRSVKGTGFDYWLGKEANASLPFQDVIRLEISGIFKGNEQSIRQRVNKKLKQVSRSDDMGIPVLIIVTEFSQPVSHFVYS